jgi:hypothetical protein
MDSALFDADLVDAAPDPPECSGEVCGLGVPDRPCFDRDGARALDDEGACCYCGWQPSVRWVANMCRSAAGLALQERRDLTVGPPCSANPAEADLLHREGLVGVYVLA